MHRYYGRHHQRNDASSSDRLLSANPDGTARFTHISTLLKLANDQHLRLLGGQTIHTRISSDQDSEANQLAFDRAFEENGASVPTTCGRFQLTTAQRQVIFYLSSPLLSPRTATVEVSRRSINLLSDPNYCSDDDETNAPAAAAPPSGGCGSSESSSSSSSSSAALDARRAVLRRRAAALPSSSSSPAARTLKCSSKRKLATTAIQQRGSIPQLTVLALGTGTGKTLIALSAAMRIMIHEWDRLLANAKDICHARTCGRISGLSTVDIGDPPTCARVTVCLVPRNVMNQWVRTFHALCSTWPNADAHRCQLWQGIKPMTYSMKVATQLPGAPPVVWMVPVGSDAINVLTDWPSIPIAAIIYDEMTEKIGKRVQLPTSPVLGGTIIAQATIERLDVATARNPNHPMRIALFNNLVRDVTPASIEEHIAFGRLGKAQACMHARTCLQVLLIPSFLSKRITEEAVLKMPAGILAHVVTFKRSTLGGIVGINDVQVSNVSGALRHIFRVDTDDRLPKPLVRLLRAQQNQQQLDPQTLLEALRAVEETHKDHACAARMADKIENVVDGKATCAICMCTQAELDADDAHLSSNDDEDDDRDDDHDRDQQEYSGDGDTRVVHARSRNKLVFASCCTGIFCIKCMNKAKRRRAECPLCCQVATRGVLFPQAELRNNEQGDEGAPQKERCEQQQNNDETVESTFQDCLLRLSDRHRRMPAAKAAAHIVRAAVEKLANGRGARVLLFFDMATSYSGINQNADYLLRTHFRDVVPTAKLYNLEAMSTNTRLSKNALEAYTDADNQDTIVLLCTTSDNSKSIAGLDLVNTHVTIVCGHMSDSNRHQLVGRVLRMTSVEHFQRRHAHFVNLVSE